MEMTEIVTKFVSSASFSTEFHENRTKVLVADKRTGVLCT